MNSNLTKIVSAQPLKNLNQFKLSAFDNNSNFLYSINTTIGDFLNNEYLLEYIGDDYINMVEDNTLWYLGSVDYVDNYKLTKYQNLDMTSMVTSTSVKIGLLRLGELMAGQFDIYDNNIQYYLVTPYKNNSDLWYIYPEAVAGHTVSNTVIGVRPSLNLKSNVQIVNGDGTLNSPFELQLVS